MSPEPYLRSPTFRAVTILFAVVLCCLPSFAQQTKVLAPHKPIMPKVMATYPLPPGVPGSLVGGPWMVDGNFKSSIYLKNGVETSPVTVTPILYLSNGTKYTLPVVQLDPAGTAIVDINAALQNLGIAPYATLSGYVELDYNWPWDPICATLRNLDIAHSLILDYGFRSTKPIQMPNQPPPSTSPITNVIEGIWWKQEANVTGFVALANTTSQPLSAEVQVSDTQGASFAQHTVEISPHGMKTVSLDELASAPTAEGGIRITYTGTATDLIINGGLEDQNVGYSAGLPFTTAPALSTASKITVGELGLMTGPADPMMSFPAGIVFTPYTVLRNVSNNPLAATPTVWWMAGGTAQSAPLSTISLLPYQTHTLNVPSMLATAGLKNFAGSLHLVFDVQGNTGGLLMTGGSVDQTYNYVFGITPHGISESGSKSLSYWSTANGDDTMVTLWNPADESQDFIFHLTYSGGHYGYPVHLEPRATRAFNVSEITQSQFPDAEGNIIPATVHEGSATTMGSSHAHNEHVLVVMDAGTYNVRKATCSIYCQTCNGVTGFSVAADPFAVTVGGQTQQTLYETWNTGSQYNDNSASSWSTSKSSVATVGSGQTAGLVTGVGAGSASIAAQYLYDDPEYTSYWCEQAWWSCPLYLTSGGGSAPGTVIPVITSISPTFLNAGDNQKSLTINGTGFGTSPTVGLPSGVTLDSTNQQTSTNTQIQLSAVDVAATTYIGANSITVTANGYTSSPAGFTIDGPDHMLVQGDVLGKCTGCTTAVRRQVNLQVIKFSGSPVFVIPVGEVASASGWNCGGSFPGVTTTPCTQGLDTNTDGMFYDAWSISSDSYAPVGCGYNFTTHWQWCTAPKTVGTLTGYTHTNAIGMNGVVNPPNQFTVGTPVYP